MLKRDMLAQLAVSLAWWTWMIWACGENTFWALALYSLSRPTTYYHISSIWCPPTSIWWPTTSNWCP